MLKLYKVRFDDCTFTYINAQNSFNATQAVDILFKAADKKDIIGSEIAPYCPIMDFTPPIAENILDLRR